MAIPKNNVKLLYFNRSCQKSNNVQRRTHSSLVSLSCHGAWPWTSIHLQTPSVTNHQYLSRTTGACILLIVGFIGVLKKHVFCGIFGVCSSNGPWHSHVSSFLSSTCLLLTGRNGLPSTQLQIKEVGNEGSHANTYLIIVFQCGGIYGTALMSPCDLVYHTFEFATVQAYFEESPYPVYELLALTPRSFVEASGFTTFLPSSSRMCSRYIPPYPHLPA